MEVQLVFIWGGYYMKLFGVHNMPNTLKIVLWLCMAVSLVACAYEKSTGHDYEPTSGFFSPDPSPEEVQRQLYCARKNYNGDYSDQICSEN
jgi:hypothetical protein